MMSKIEEYDSAKRATASAFADLKVKIDILCALVRRLEKEDCISLLSSHLPPLNPSLERNNDGAYRVDEIDWLDVVALDDLPSVEVLRSALMKLRDAKRAETETFGRLSDIEKGYVRRPDRQRERR